MKSCYIIREGRTGGDEWILCVCKEKEITEDLCREDGYNALTNDVWGRYIGDDAYYRKIEKVNFYE